jgi:hypothetical protein
MTKNVIVADKIGYGFMGSLADEKRPDISAGPFSG